MSYVSPNVKTIARIAHGFYGEVFGKESMDQALADLASAGSINAYANLVYADVFGAMSLADVAAEVVANVGITTAGQVAEARSIVQVELAASAANDRGAYLLALIDKFRALTDNVYYKDAANSFNTQIEAAATYGVTAGTADVEVTGTPVEIPVVGETFTLTTSTNAFTGAAGDDTFNADAQSAATQSLNTADRLDGGAGDDVLNASLFSSVTPASIAGIETLNLTAGADSTLTTSNVTGATLIKNVGSTGKLTVGGLASTAIDLAVADVSDVQTVFAYTAAAVAGSADAVNLTVSNVVDSATAGDSTITISGVETLNVTASGGASVLTTITDTSLKTLNVAGDQALTVTTLPASVTKIDASANTGGFTTAIAAGGTGAMTITGSAGNDSIVMSAAAGDSKISLGAGNDRLTFNATGTLTTADTVDGGDGVDTLVNTAAQFESLDGAVMTKVSGFETIELSDNDVTTALNTAAFGAITTFVAPTGTDGDYTVTFGTGGGTFQLGKTSGDTAALGGATGITVSGTSTTDTATFLYKTADADSAAKAFTATGVETLVISNSVAADTFGTVTMTGTDGVATTLKLEGTKAMTLGAVSASKIDASGMTSSTGALTMASSGNTATNVTGGAGNDTLYGHATSATTLTGGNGADTITGGTGNDVAYGGAGNDTISLSTGTADKAYGEDGNDLIIAGSGLGSSDIVDGGAGNDTLQLDAAITSTAVGARVSNIETLEFTTASTQDLNYLVNGGITGIKYSATGTTAITAAPASLATLTFSTSTDATTASMARWTDSSSDSITLSLGSASTGADSDPGTVTINDEETISIESNGILGTTANTITTLNASDAKTITITGAGDLTISALNVVNSLTGSGAVTVDATAATGVISVNAETTFSGYYGGAITFLAGSGETTFYGSWSSDVITGGTANDTLGDGYGGDDTIDGGAGNDTIYAYDGADSLNGGSGTDTISYANNWTLDGSENNDTDGGLEPIIGVVINLSASAVTLATVNSNTEGYIATSSVASNTAQYLFADNSDVMSEIVDTLVSFENATGSAGEDYIIGSSASNVLDGGAGNDLIDGGSGNDTIYGGAGNDLIYASPGSDVVHLGDGADTFRFSSSDADTAVASWTAANVTISGGFVSGSDKFLVFGSSTVAANGNGTNYSESLADKGSFAQFVSAADTALNGTVKYYFSLVGTDGYLAYDDDGSGITYIVKLTGVTDMAATDIVAAATNASVTGLSGYGG